MHKNKTILKQMFTYFNNRLSNFSARIELKTFLNLKTFFCKKVRFQSHSRILFCSTNFSQYFCKYKCLIMAM